MCKVSSRVDFQVWKCKSQGVSGSNDPACCRPYDREADQKSKRHRVGNSPTHHPDIGIGRYGPEATLGYGRLPHEKH